MTLLESVLLQLPWVARGALSGYFRYHLPSPIDRLKYYSTAYGHQACIRIMPSCYLTFNVNGGTPHTEQEV
jgi:hypothetical protein